MVCRPGFERSGIYIDSILDTFPSWKPGKPWQAPLRKRRGKQSHVRVARLDPPGAEGGWAAKLGHNLPLPQLGAPAPDAE